MARIVSGPHKYYRVTRTGGTQVPFSFFMTAEEADELFNLMAEQFEHFAKYKADTREVVM